MLPTMHSYAALVGHQPLLSKAELGAVFADLTPGPTYDNQYYIFSTATEIDQALLDTLGGTLMIAKRVGQPINDISEIPALLCAEVATMKGKVTFALRFAGITPAKAKDLYRQCKQALKQKNISSRYVGSEREAAKAIQLHDEGLLDPKKGCEILVLQDEENGLWIGRTVAAQNVKAYTLRDMEKPVRDLTVGLLPPKLAQILLNFGAFMAKKNKDVIVLDPFCGTGVIPMEALLRHWNVLASDNAQKAVGGCEKNIEWTRKTYKIAKKDVDCTVWKQDATKGFELKQKPDIIVTEGTLGPNLKSRPTVKDAERLLKNAEELETKFLQNCAKTLPGCPIVMIWPVWYAQKRQLLLEKVVTAATEAGYRMVLPPHASPSVDDRLTLIYRRPDQFVGREIVLLQPKKS
jgi:tRNA G10  N-methylase Trm11